MIHTIFHKSLYGDLGNIDIDSKNTILDCSLYSNERIYDDSMDYNTDNSDVYIIFLV